jgi:hypothetical protein
MRPNLINLVQKSKYLTVGKLVKQINSQAERVGMDL